MYKQTEVNLGKINFEKLTLMHLIPNTMKIAKAHNILENTGFCRTGFKY